MTSRQEKLIAELRERQDTWRDGIARTREMVLSNLAMLAEVPAETFREDARAALIVDRYMATAITEPTTDRLNNAIGILRGKSRAATTLVFTHMDHQFPATEDQTITITEDRVIGRGIAEDTLALAVLISLPDILQELDLPLERDLVLLATTRSHGRGDYGGTRHYLEENDQAIDNAVCLDSIPLGKINYSSLSRVRCDILCEIGAASSSPWGMMTNTSAILILNEVLNQLSAIPLPRQPKTSINVGMIEGGERYSTVSTRARAHVEVLCENDDMMETIIESIADRCVDVGAKHGVKISTDFFGRHHAAGLSYAHPLIKAAASIASHLGYDPIVEHGSSEITVPLAMGIPAVNLGLTTGRANPKERGHVMLEPLSAGILQLLALLYAIDKGYCDDRPD